MLKDSVMQLLLALIQLIAVGALGFLIDYLKAKASNEKLKEFYEYAKIIVRNMEGTVIQRGAGDKKKEQGIQDLISLSKGKLTDEDAEKLIESAFQEVVKVLKVKGLE